MRRSRGTHDLVKALWFTVSASTLLAACATAPAADGEARAMSSGEPVASAPAPDGAGPVSSSLRTGSEEISVYFIGNSLTFYNDLPRMFADLAAAAGRSVAVDLSFSGGGTLAGHARSWSTLNKLGQRSWKFVVLQEQSDLPAVEAQRRESVLPPLRVFKERIEGIGATPVLFMTWGRKDGLPAEGFSTYTEMQDALETGFIEMAGELRWMLVPAGIAWRNSAAQRPQVELWLADGIHPTPEGTYLTACVFYASIFERSPEGIGFHAGLPEDTARYLQGIAAAAVLGVLPRWKPASR